MIDLRHKFEEIPWCVVGDFNSVRNAEERKGNKEIGRNGVGEIAEFNGFTWFRPNRMARSRLDRFLITHDWWNLWPNNAQ